MNLCSDNHPEICFEGRTCPLCAKMEEHEQDVTELKTRIAELEERIESLS